MNKGLEELKRIAYYSACCRCQYYIDRECTNKDECCWKTIEQELKEYQQHEEILNNYGLTLANFREACLLLAMLKGEGRTIHNIDKQLKALEIIKKAEDIDKKIILTLFENGVIPKEEYGLLKEVLL